MFKQSVKLEERIIKFENCFKQVPVPFNIYAEFECNLKTVKCNEGSYTERPKTKTIFLVVLLIKLFVLMINLLNQLLSIEVKIQLINLLKQLKNINIAKK